MIGYETLKQLLRLTALIYEYGKSFDWGVDGTLVDIVHHDPPMSTTRVDMLVDASDHSPHGTIEYFLSDIDSDIQVGITKSTVNKHVCVVFRGSESGSDWYHNLMIMKREIQEGVSVHSGFYQQLHTNRTFDKIKHRVNELKKTHPDYRLYITGHSLGGALATLFGYEYGLSTNCPVCVVTFGSPRVGNAGFAKAFGDMTNVVHYRVTNQRDVVTAIPSLLYYHCGVNISLYSESFQVFSQCQIPWWRYNLMYCWSIADHRIDNYYKQLLKVRW